MKINKISEKLENRKFSDMKNWGKERLRETYAGVKTINYELGAKVIELLAEYGLGIVSVDPNAKWLNKAGLLIPGEQNFREYRVTIGKKQNWDDFIEEYEYKNDVSYDELSEEEQEKVQEIYSESPYKPSNSHTAEIEFSVFLPKVNNLEEAAMSDASSYLKILYESNLTVVTNGSARYNVFEENVNEVIDFINNRHILITNKNLKDVRTISYRLYKDSKVFNAFESNLKNYKEFFRKWENLL